MKYGRLPGGERLPGDVVADRHLHDPVGGQLGEALAGGDAALLADAQVGRVVGAVLVLGEGVATVGAVQRVPVVAVAGLTDLDGDPQRRRAGVEQGLGVGDGLVEGRRALRREVGVRQHGDVLDGPRHAVRRCPPRSRRRPPSAGTTRPSTPDRSGPGSRSGRTRRSRRARPRRCQGRHRWRSPRRAVLPAGRHRGTSRGCRSRRWLRPRPCTGARSRTPCSPSRLPTPPTRPQRQPSAAAGRTVARSAVPSAGGASSAAAAPSDAGGLGRTIVVVVTAAGGAERGLLPPARRRPSRGCSECAWMTPCDVWWTPTAERRSNTPAAKVARFVHSLQDVQSDMIARCECVGARSPTSPG